MRCITEKCPFPPDSCDICVLRSSYERVYDMDQSKQLLEIYDALSCPAYLFTQTVVNDKTELTDMDLVDPITEAFKLSEEMQLMQTTDPSFKVYHYFQQIYLQFSQ